jgi:histidinol-phosphate/aromatic aminotransferase/cobyric acid decarboxylase-like protein
VCPFVCGNANGTSVFCAKSTSRKDQRSIEYFQIKEIEEKLRDSDAVVFVNPNNPTGSIIGSSWIMNLARQNPNKYFIVDESFIEFSDECSIIDYLEIHPSDNVIVLRSMSKSYGLPGVRLGFVYTTNEELLQKINTKIPIWNLNSVAEFYLEIILKNKRSLVESFERTKLARENFIMDLRELRFVEHVYESHADFVLIKTTEDVEQIGNFSQFLLNNYGIYVKNVSKRYSMVNNCYYRFAVRLQEENKLLIKSLADFQKNFFK